MASSRPKVFLRLRPKVKTIQESEQSDDPFCTAHPDVGTIGFEREFTTSSLGVCRELDQEVRFDAVFDTDSSQEDVFVRLWDDIRPAVQNGLNSTNIMHGATGSGKTYTMDGDLENEKNKEFLCGLFGRCILRCLQYQSS
jgi:hypothetical protein